MMKSATVNYMNPSVIKQEGIKALSAALTPVGMAYFFRLLESGEGNYTEEKDELTKDFTTSSIMSALGAMQKERE